MTGRGALALIVVFFAMVGVISRDPTGDLVSAVTSVLLTIALILAICLVLGRGRGGRPVQLVETGFRSIQVDIDRYGADAVLALCTQITEPVPDPGHPGGMPLVLWRPPPQYGRVRVLECFNGTPEPDGSYERVALGVDAGHTDPVAAAAASYGLDPDTYRRMSRRV